MKKILILLLVLTNYCFAADQKKLNEDLRKAVDEGNVELVEKFLREGANPNVSMEGNPLIMNALFDLTRRDPVEGKDYLGVIRLLLQYRTDLDKANMSGETFYDWLNNASVDPERKKQVIDILRKDIIKEIQESKQLDPDAGRLVGEYIL